MQLPKDNPPSRAGKGGQHAMGDYGLTVEICHRPGHVLVTVAGEADIATVPQLQERLTALAPSGRPFIVDLDRVTFIDVPGLGVPASAASRAAQHGSSRQLACARHLVGRLFTITGLPVHARHQELSPRRQQADRPIQGERAGLHNAPTRILDGWSGRVNAGRERAAGPAFARIGIMQVARVLAHALPVSD